MSIPIFEKQPGDTEDYDLDFADYFTDENGVATADTVLSASAIADAGITLGDTVIDAANKKVKQWVSGGTTGTTYKITVTMTSTLIGTVSRVKEVEFKVKVKEV